MLSDSFGHCSAIPWALKALSQIPVLAEALNPQLGYCLRTTFQKCPFPTHLVVGAHLNTYGIEF